MSRSSAAANRAPRGFLSSGLSVNAGSRARRRTSEVAVECGLARPLAGRVVHDQRRIEGDEAFVADERRDGVDDARVILRGTDVEQSAVGVDCRDTGLVLLAPREVESNEVHAGYPAPTRRRKL